ncbi:hypothetical protein RGUI_0457 [Rhodovulum sp. P5]|uniref:hypothetical protein n=1 Tax=Rhodovulum sp. P5 TaxID=1564506 RepID=UPI0009C2B29D|nr:hypothetical protein [Rhodovulum sp. P5]ARE38598.1 hypothetical protein RGUI_0457 [Rhodovulum sp. P5]
MKRQTLLALTTALGGFALPALADDITVMSVNRHWIVTPYRRRKLTPLELSWPGAA